MFKAVPELYFIFLIVPTYVSLGKVLTRPVPPVADRELKLKVTRLGMGKKLGHQTSSTSRVYLIVTSKAPCGMGTTFCSEILKLSLDQTRTRFFLFCDLGSTLITVFDQVGNIPCMNYDEEFAVHICHRHDHYPQLHIRKARYGWHSACVM